MYKKQNIFIYLIFFIQLFCLFLNSNTDSSFKEEEFIYPTTTTQISSYFGYRELFDSTSFHSGVDFPVPRGTQVFATNSGIIKHYGFINGYGISIIIEHPNGYQSLYAHLDENVENFVKIGMNVSRGQLIANVGPKFLSDGRQNGLTTGPHLHFTIYDEKHQLIDPLSLNLKEKIRV